MQGKVGLGRSISFGGGIALGVLLAFPAAYALFRADEITARQAVKPEVARAQAAKLVADSQRAIDERNLQDAVDLLVRADRLDPKNPNVHNNLCVASTLLRRYDDAVAACNAALALKPDFQLAKNNLRWALDERAKARKASEPKP